ncbi:bifunctional serine hydroxymethyltransferase/L-allo-threonine aldolase [Methanotorris igneus]|uniref:Serine hydroxymethyltransferase n=1 Tax=Methanotorris igneus (strain DSM 5666 / JCM 11834 / Kol 5) TaxID=880724 RepID=F6BED9_METIK|nr:bifunctional serine hydroxymethyltransferase/L-allo-threonine aldolase [Methanotorris igneus]AEF95600.1 Glycine hydroxymethyltransferase [Methanotorris igneus Kol 5]
MNPSEVPGYVRDVLMKHHNWMRESIKLIASENIASRAVREACASDFAHRYAEGLPGKRLYQGCKYIDMVEELAIELAKDVFNAEHANVQPTSGVVANLAVFFAETKPGDTLMAMDVPNGGHISHWKVSAAGIRGLKIVPHPFDEKEMNIDVDKMIKEIYEHKPRLILFGGSLFLFPHPVKEAVDAAKEIGATVAYDGAHVLGLIAGKQFQDPLREGADYLMGSTHKTFFGPQGGIILTKKEYAEKIDEKVFPGVVSNHHLHHKAGLAIALAEAKEFGEAYAKQVIKNAKALAQALYERGFNVLCEDKGFTESHQVVLDIAGSKDIPFSASELAKMYEDANIILNKNLLPWDDVNKSDDPSGIRLGTQECTRLGMKESEMEEIAEFMKRIAIDKEKPEKVREDVKEFAREYSTVHYSFDGGDAFEYIKF